MAKLNDAVRLLEHAANSLQLDSLEAFRDQVSESAGYLGEAGIAATQAFAPLLRELDEQTQKLEEAAVVIMTEIRNAAARLAAGGSITA